MKPKTSAADEPQSDPFQHLRLELRRGCLILAALSHLKSEHYGYTLRKGLESVGLEIEEGTLYPLLRRLEDQGLLQSQWREENRRKKRFYRLTVQGESVLTRLLEEFARIDSALARIVSGA